MRESYVSGALTLLLVLSGAGAAATSAAGQQFRAGVEVQHIQVSVAGPGGAFVPDLAAGDFELRVDGEVRPIVTAYSIDADAPDAAWLAGSGEAWSDGEAGAEVVELDSLPAAARRRFLLFVDLSAMSYTGMRNMRRATVEFLAEQVRPADLLGMAIYSPIRGLEYVVPFTGRHELVDEALEALSTFSATEATASTGEGIPLDDIIDFYSSVEGVGGGGAAGSSDATPALGDSGIGSVTDFVQEIDQTRYEAAAEMMLDSLGELAGTLAATEGRKYVLMFSHGLPDQILENGGITDALDAFTATARRSDVVFYTFDPRNVGGAGFDGGFDLTQQESSWSAGSTRSLLANRSVLHALARETGGRASFWRGGVKDGLVEMERATNDYYLLAFPLRPGDPDTVQLEVDVRRPGVEITWAPRELRVRGDEGGTDRFRRQFQVAEALEIGAGGDQLGLQVRAWLLPADGRPGRRVAVAAQLDASAVERLRAANAGAPVQLEVLGLTMGSDRLVTDYFQAVARTADGAGSDRAAGAPTGPAEEAGAGAEPFRFASWIRVPAGRHFVKVLVRESGSGELSTRNLAITVPEGDEAGLRVAPPLPVLAPSQAPMLRGVPLSTTELVELGEDADPWSVALGRRERRVAFYEDPFSVNGMPVTIDLSDVIRAGQELVTMASVQGVMADPDSGDPRVAVSLALVDSDGRTVPLRPLTVTRSNWSPEERELKILLRASLPADLQSGAYRLQLTASDAVAGTDRSSELAVSVIDG